ncbi:hypothetical protein ACJX0J_023328, partial [Zea mays]
HRGAGEDNKEQGTAGYVQVNMNNKVGSFGAFFMGGGGGGGIGRIINIFKKLETHFYIPIYFKVIGIYLIK